jgi:hypothetical protein
LRQGDLLTSANNARRKIRLLRSWIFLCAAIYCAGDVGCQWTPKYGATYLEIEEHFGGFNFGGGNGQLDLATMEFDRAYG